MIVHLVHVVHSVQQVVLVVVRLLVEMGARLVLVVAVVVQDASQHVLLPHVNLDVVVLPVLETVILLVALLVVPTVLLLVQILVLIVAIMGVVMVVLPE